MKKVFFIPLLIFSLLLTGCITEREVPEDKTGEYLEMISSLEETQEILEDEIAVLEKAVEDAKPKVAVIEPGPEPQKRLTMTELDTFSHDIDGDGLVEKVTLYTSAARDDQGRMMWDDGQQFLLVLGDGENFYSLFDGYVQLGRIFYTIYTGDEDSNPGVLALVSTYDGLSLVNHEFLPDGSIGSTETYPTGDMNVIYSSIAWD